MTVGNSEGDRRCDERCYNAKLPNCDCVCGGKNHGVGEKQAMANVCDLAQEALNRLREAGIEVKPLQLKAS